MSIHPLSGGGGRTHVFWRDAVEEGRELFDGGNFCRAGVGADEEEGAWLGV